MSYGNYTFELPGYGISFDADRLRRDHQELLGELSVKCSLPGAQTVNGMLSTGDFNFSSVRARSERAKILKERSHTNGDIDWFGLLEEFTQRVFQAEREGDPSIDLRDVPRPAPDNLIRVFGLAFPSQHPSILFGDGGSMKSYTALLILGELARAGRSVALFDWELGAEDHRERLELLYGTDMPKIQYVRCERPLVAEADRLRRIVKEHNIQYAVYDSVAFACDGPPEAAEIAGKYFRCLREIRCGSLHIAHISKNENSDMKPFGSSFWHNGARSTWNCQAQEPDHAGRISLGFWNRKTNLGPLFKPTAVSVHFERDRTYFEYTEIAGNSEFAEKLSIRQRMNHLLKRGARTPEEIAEELGAKLESVQRKIRDYKHEFVVIEGGRIGLRTWAS